MLFLLFIHSLTAGVSSVAAADNQTAPTSCNDLNSCRSLLNIIWSCLTTIFLCTWVAIHPNVPEPVDTTEMNFMQKCIHNISCFIQDKVPLFICALLIPEYILAWAIRQHLIARQIVKENKDSKLTRAHGFFMIMGGFHYFTSSSGTRDTHEMTNSDPPIKESDPEEITNGKEAPVHPLSYKNVLLMVKKQQIRLPTEVEIQNTSKSDWLAKALVLLQTGWFVIQCIARRVEHLPTTELEIITLAYAAMNFAIYIAWWDKPHNVGCPMRVFQRPSELESGEDKNGWLKMAGIIIGGQDDTVTLHKRRKVPIFYSGDTEGDAAVIADGIVLAIGVIFGAIHCIAWSFTFSSHTEAVMWRASSVIITAIPIFLLIAALGGSVLGVPIPCIILTMSLLGVAYVAARFTTIILAIMNLSSLPPGAFEAVDWTIRIPHLS